LVTSACNPDTASDALPRSKPDDSEQVDGGGDPPQDEQNKPEDSAPHAPPVEPGESMDDWLKSNTISLRNLVSMPSPAARLSASEIVTQLRNYDPGSLLRCEVQDDPAYRAAVDTLGGVTWGYSVGLLEDKSKPELRLGPPLPILAVPGVNADSAGASGAVVIEEADIVGLSESAALFYSAAHGLLLVDLSGAEPRFKCAAKLPGTVKNFFYYQDHLVALVTGSILHFKVVSGSLRFVEAIKLNGDVLDTRRFNDKLVVYTHFVLEQTNAAPANGGVSQVRPVYAQQSKHRSLQVFKFGETLVEELNESLINTTLDDAYLRSGAVAQDTAIGTVVNSASSYGDVLWASDHYFVVTENLDITKLNGWITQYYQVCTKNHVVSSTYRYCETRYETRANPDYVPPDNSGGDRACKGVTLADCLRTVSRASNPTIQVPVGIECGDRTNTQWFCDAYENRSSTYPDLRTESSTRLTIFEYTESGFVRLDSKVHEITTPALADVQANASIEKLTTSSTAFDLSVPGRLQTLYFQNGFLYAIANGVLQVYSMGESSLVRTSSLRVANDTLQASLFGPDRLYLSDFGYSSSGNDHSTLRVIDLTNPGFPKQVSDDRTLPGGHSSILATSSGILTIGAVQNFAPDIMNVLKLGLFADPFTSEKAYLILGTDLKSTLLGDKKAQFFDADQGRLFLPYTGYDRETMKQHRARIGVSHLTADEIVSEGALAMAEPVERVRPRPAVPDQFLSFSASTVSWLKATDTKWNASPVLAYYTPFALYRQNDHDDYVELSRLGSRCQLRWVNAATLNATKAPLEENAFDCGQGQPTAYGNNLLFWEGTGVRFDAEGKVTTLTTSEVADLSIKIGQRQVCLFSETATNQALDYSKLPPADLLKCYSAAAYQTLARR
jgi:hypothetical protein